jgi:hypothetical protein
MNHSNSIQILRRRKWVGLLAATLAGGSLLETCQTRLRDGIVGGTENYILSLLDPTLFIEDLLDDGTSTEEP